MTTALILVGLIILGGLGAMYLWRQDRKRRRKRKHHPVPVFVEVYEMDGTHTQEIQVRCGCTDSWEHDYGHEVIHEEQG